MKRAHSTVTRGVGALTKSMLLVAGVPAAVVRLWSLDALPSHPFAPRALASMSEWLHMALVVVAVLWAWAAISLVRDVIVAVRRRESGDRSSWSTRWAGAIAGLVLSMTAGSAVAGGVASYLAVHDTARSAVTAPRNNAAPHVDPHPFTEQPSVAVVARGECAADVARRVTGGRADWVPMVRAVLGSLQPDGTRVLDANLLRAGWCLPAPATVFAPPAPGGTEEHSNPERRLVEAGLVGLGILGTAALARRMRALRRLAEAGRRPGERFVRRNPRLGELDALTRPLAEAPLVDWIDVTLRLAARAARLGDSRPEIHLVRAGPDGVELLLASPISSAAPPLVATDGGRWWTLPSSSELTSAAALARDDGRLEPWLVPVGDDGEAAYLVAAAPGRALVVEGDDDAVEGYLSSVVAALRTLPWADELDVELVGLDAPPLSEHAYGLVGSSPDALAELAASPPPAPRHQTRPRWRREPLVVVTRSALGDDGVDLLRRVAHVAGTVGPLGQATERLIVRDGRAELSPYGLVLEVPMPTRDQSALVDRLLAEAGAPAIIPISEEVSDLPGNADLHIRAAAEVELRLLAGGVELIGVTATSGTRDASRVVELLAHLAIHGGHAAAAALEEAIYFRDDATWRARRLANVIAAARSFTTGAPLVTRRGDDVVLSSAVSCDWTRFREATALARRATPEAARVLLDEALSLVDSPAVVAGSTFDWCVREGLDAEMRAEIVDASHHAFSLALSDEDHRAARAALAVGLGVDDSAEMLVRDAMLLAHRDRDTPTLRRVFGDLEAALFELAGTEPTPETRALFDSLGDDALR